MTERIRFIDVFSGCGGLSLGLLNAGLSGILAVEKHPSAFQSLRHNLIAHRSCFDWPSSLPISNWDIDVLLESFSAEIDQLRGRIDIVVGGPPCQGFSTAGKRRALDRRNRLIESYLRFVERVRPGAIFFENVRGFAMRFDASHGESHVPYSDVVLSKLQELGYEDARGEILNLAEFGVPQNRRRFVVLGTLRGVSDEIFGRLHENRKAFLDSRGIGEFVSSKCAISDLERRHGVVECPDSRRFLSGMTSGIRSTYQKMVRQELWTRYVPDSHRFVNHTHAIQEAFRLLLEKAPRNRSIKGEERKRYGLRKRSVMVLDPDRPAPTITTIPDDFVHYSEPRVMTVRECARLQTFPDWYEFKGPYTTGNRQRANQVPRYTQVGNAVPPLFAEQLGIALSQTIKDT